MDISHMTLIQLIELERDITQRKEELVKIVKILPPVNIVELKLWNNGKKIHAIAAYRDRTGLGLVHSREAFMLCLSGNEVNSNIK